MGHININVRKYFVTDCDYLSHCYEKRHINV